MTPRTVGTLAMAALVLLDLVLCLLGYFGELRERRRT